MAQLLKTWRFRSNSNPNKTYETSQYVDGSTSCQCRGWTFAKHGVRSCTHTRMVEMGRADQEAVSVWNNPERVDVNVRETRQVELNARQRFAESASAPGFDTVANHTKQAEELENARQWSMTESNTKKLARIKKQLEKPKTAIPVPKRLVNWR